MLVICSADVAGHLRLIDGQQLQQCHILESFEGTMKGRFSVHLQLKRVSREPKQYCVCLFNRGDQGGDSYCRRDLGFPQAGNVSGKRLLMKLLDMVDLITSLSRRAWLGIPHGQGSILIIILCTLRRDNVQLRKGSNIHDEFNSSSRVSNTKPNASVPGLRSSSWLPPKLSPRLHNTPSPSDWDISGCLAVFRVDRVCFNVKFRKLRPFDTLWPLLHSPPYRCLRFT
ncbi:BnaC05g30520D [Brassica napus]|uniref:(rape) hypothetical protein n=1 Tax=Brassica napus TaxID=3708 RepID=A0A078HKI5_BRANA|nr:unnamed protein product [Brassica napus]CDY37378.1 BnaC05g30520D [Brassica napus]